MIKKDEATFRYPRPNNLCVNEADLQLMLLEQGKNNHCKVRMADFLLLISTWAILFTADMRDFWMIPGKEFRGVLAILVLIVSLEFLFKLVKCVKYPLWLSKLYTSIVNDSDRPERLIEKIKNKSSTTYI